MKVKPATRLAFRLAAAACLTAGMLIGQALPSQAVAGAPAIKSGDGNPTPTVPPSAQRVTPVAPSGNVSIGKSSTWYWQNPTPHPYSVNAIACSSAARCVAMGGSGAILRTSDAGRHWTARTVGGVAWVGSVSCPARAVCYAIGNKNGNSPSRLLKSVDGGATWKQTPLSRQPVRTALRVSDLSA